MAVEHLIECLVEDRAVKFTGYGIVVCYDVPTLEVREGRGVVTSLHNSVIRKLEAAGKVTRLQRSVIQVEDPAALPLIIDVLKRVNARFLVIEGRITYIEEGDREWKPLE
ncbi:MAG: hypothetical protein QXZ31_06750 [Thermofilaceae archaeon]